MNSPTSHSNQRTQWAERHIEEFIALPLIAEFVFRSPKMIDATQKEVVDFLVVNDGAGVLISQKCQEAPSKRSRDKTGTWARKAAKKAAIQLRGALKTGATKPIWCTHPRRGRVEFPDGLPVIDHGIVIVEVLQPIDLGPEADKFPLDVQGVPISYLSVNDFLNLTVELRTVPELLAYLNARRGLSASDQRMIGVERALFENYLLNNGSLPVGVTRERALEVSLVHQGEVRSLLRSKRDLDRYGTLLEHVADQLATRHSEYAKDLTPAVLARFEPPDARTTYLEMQGVLANLRLPERGQLGRAFAGVIEQMSVQREGFSYMAAHLDSKPEWVFVFGSSRGVGRPDLLDRMQNLSTAAVAFFGKSRCMAVIDRDGLSYEVGFLHAETAPTALERQNGERLFGRLRIMDEPIELVSQRS